MLLCITVITLPSLCIYAPLITSMRWCDESTRGTAWCIWMLTCSQCKTSSLRSQWNTDSLRHRCNKQVLRERGSRSAIHNFLKTATTPYRLNEWKDKAQNSTRGRINDVSNQISAKKVARRLSKLKCPCASVARRSDSGALPSRSPTKSSAKESKAAVSIDTSTSLCVVTLWTCNRGKYGYVCHTLTAVSRQQRFTIPFMAWQHKHRPRVTARRFHPTPAI